MQPSRQHHALSFLAIGYGLAVVVLLGFIWQEGALLADDSAYFKALKYMASLSLMAFTWRSLSHRLPLRWQQVTLHYATAACLFWFGLVYVFTVFRYENRPPRWADAVGTFWWHSFWVCMTLWAVLNLYTLVLLLQADRRKFALPQLWAFRFGLFLQLAVVVYAGWAFLAELQFYLPYTYGNPGYPFYNWQVKDEAIRNLYGAASHGLVYLAALGWLLSRKRLYQPYIAVVETKTYMTDSHLVSEPIKQPGNKLDNRGPTLAALFIALLSMLLLFGLGVAWVAQVTGKVLW